VAWRVGNLISSGARAGGWQTITDRPCSRVGARVGHITSHDRILDLAGAIARWVEQPEQQQQRQQSNDNGPEPLATRTGRGRVGHGGLLSVRGFRLTGSPVDAFRSREATLPPMMPVRR